MTGNDIRESFLRFFAERGHAVVPSASLIPASDPTLLFTNAGMVPFKNVLLGLEQPTHSRVVDSQKCLRVSGKHNDLEEVGRDTYHHTFFEMLGNWSFGDYYKKEAIAWAWQLLTEVWKLPAALLWATVYHTDDEAEHCWRTVTDINPGQILRFGEKDNFWEMGATGPCGPCSEIHIDRGPHACDRANSPGHTCGVNAGCARYIELWNLVFIQYDRKSDLSLEDLPAKHVDTGMGLERVAAILQAVPGNYDSDLLRQVIAFTEELSQRRYGLDASVDVSFRVIADHARAATFVIADGAVPTNEGRGYVLRRIIRRALRHGRLLGFPGPFLSRVTESVVRLMGSAYPELTDRREYVSEVVRSEEQRFAETLDKGLARLEQDISELHRRGVRVLSGQAAFRLYDTYGFPVDLTEDFLLSEDLTLDQEGFRRAMQDQRARARRGQKDTASAATGLGELASRFVGDEANDWQSEIIGILVNGAWRADSVQAGEELELVASETPFYAESGGQVGDTGLIECRNGSVVDVVDTQRPLPGVIVQRGRVRRGAVQTGDQVRLAIDAERRQAVRLNHSATHILHSALRQILGTHVRQAGSLVAPDRLRFDFTHTSPLDVATLEQIEALANARIRENADVTSEEMSLADALKSGALAFFGEKYGSRVRVLRMGDFSVELCGGTHVRRTGDVGLLTLKAESGVASGVRRVEATTGPAALEWVRERERRLQAIGRLLKAPQEEALDKLERVLAQQRTLERQLARLQHAVAGSKREHLVAQAKLIDGVHVVASRIEGVDKKALRDMADGLRDALAPAVIVLGVQEGEQVSLLAVVSKDVTTRYHAGDIIKQLAPLVGGGGGGRPDFAQAGGKDPSRLDFALGKVYELVGKGGA